MFDDVVGKCFYEIIIGKDFFNRYLNIIYKEKVILFY